MIRKWLAFLLAMLMLAAVPFGAMADTQHTLSVIPGDALPVDQAIADLLDVTALRLTTGENSGALTVVMNDKEIVTLGVTADEDGLYAGSEVFGDAVLHITWDDLIDLYMQAMETAMAEAGVNDEALMQELRASAEEMKTAVDAAFADDSSAAEIIAAQAMGPEDPEMAAYIEGLVDDMTVQDGEFTFEYRDAADQKYRMEMDEEDLKPLLGSDYMRSVLKESMTAQMPEATEAELEAALDEMMAEVEKLFEEMDFETVMEAYTLDEGMTLVGLDFVMNMSFEGEEDIMQMTGVYNRLTSDDAVAHEAEMTIAAEDEAVKFAFELDAGNDGKHEGLFGVLIAGEEYVIAFDTEEEGEKSILDFEVYLRSGATAILKPAASARPLFGLKIVSEPADDAKLAALENANAANSLNVMNLTPDQQNELLSNISGKGMQVYFLLLSELPTSVMQMMMGQ